MRGAGGRFLNAEEARRVLEERKASEGATSPPGRAHDSGSRETDETEDEARTADHAQGSGGGGQRTSGAEMLRDDNADSEASSRRTKDQRDGCGGGDRRGEGGEQEGGSEALAVGAEASGLCDAGSDGSDGERARKRQRGGEVARGCSPDAPAPCLASFATC